jgi:signal transduction histidine kinase
LRSRLQAVEAHTGLAVEFDCQGDVRLARETEQELYRLTQEALNNVVKHARASRVRVGLLVGDGRAVMEVADDGVGFQHATPAGGFGVPGMRERAARLGGNLHIESAPGAGTRLRIEVPA